MGLKDSRWNISISSLVILAAAVLRYHGDKRTDRHTPLKSLTSGDIATAIAVGN